MAKSNGEIVIKFKEEKTKSTKEKVSEKQKGIGDKALDLLKKITGYDDISKLIEAAGSAAIITIAIKEAIKATKIVASEAIYIQNKYYDLTDNYLGKQNMNIAIDVAKTIVGGPKEWYSKLVQAGKNDYEQRLRLNKMNTELNWNRQRAGYSLTAGAQGENR